MMCRSLRRGRGWGVSIGRWGMRIELGVFVRMGERLLRAESGRGHCITAFAVEEYLAQAAAYTQQANAITYCPC